MNYKNIFLMMGLFFISQEIRSMGPPSLFNRTYQKVVDNLELIQDGVTLVLGATSGFAGFYCFYDQNSKILSTGFFGIAALISLQWYQLKNYKKSQQALSAANKSLDATNIVLGDENQRLLCKLKW